MTKRNEPKIVVNAITGERYDNKTGRPFIEPNDSIKSGFHKFNDSYWNKYSGEKRLVQCDWCKKHIDLRKILFAPCGNSRYYPMCQNCHNNMKVVECSFKYPTNEQLGIPSKKGDKIE